MGRIEPGAILKCDQSVEASLGRLRPPHRQVDASDLLAALRTHRDVERLGVLRHVDHAVSITGAQPGPSARTLADAVRLDLEVGTAVVDRDDADGLLASAGSVQPAACDSPDLLVR